ncbi:hypothetical protein L4X63_15325 [Geomonas sp. Red32]|uniref:hypothetical protein n=1 Tax=Geomonas sp. Red32 TaxID=2912856 RepID=UPI00202CE837|nr:hypothetical protein [Geomonas sp. Red32]MCM0082964.1 hypothetical protein [Geomonas sp. Red32]
MKFRKPPLTYQQQIELLVSRGMQIDNCCRARHFLSHLNYYRLAAYWLPFELDHAGRDLAPETLYDDSQSLSSWLLSSRKSSRPA